MDTKVIVLPPHKIYEWHENPVPQWIVPLSGNWFVESMDGMRVEMGPGELMLGEDQHTNDRLGHRSGAIGDIPCVLLLIQLSESVKQLEYL